MDYVLYVSTGSAVSWFVFSWVVGWTDIRSKKTAIEENANV
jgi:hypothetical protein